MKLTAHAHDIHLTHTFTTAHGPSDARTVVQYRLEHEGVVGIGEATPHPRFGETPEGCLAAAERFNRYWKGELMHYRELHAQLDAILPDQPAAKCGLDLAVLDWFGKCLDQPLHRIWGLDPTRTPPTGLTIGIDTPEIMAAKTREAHEAPSLKVKLDGVEDRARIAAVRAAARPEQPLRVDANEGWRDREQAAREIEWLASQNVEFVEQPMPAAGEEDALWLKRRAALPLIADEACVRASDLPRLAELYHGVNIKLSKIGGILPAYDAIVTAKCLGLKTMLGCMISSSLSISAALQLAPLVDIADLDGASLLRHDPYEGVEWDHGKPTLSNWPGLGVVRRRET